MCPFPLGTQVPSPHHVRPQGSEKFNGGGETGAGGGGGGGDPFSQWKLNVQLGTTQEGKAKGPI